MSQPNSGEALQVVLDVSDTHSLPNHGTQRRRSRPPHPGEMIRILHRERGAAVQPNITRIVQQPVHAARIVRQRLGAGSCTRRPAAQMIVVRGAAPRRSKRGGMYRSSDLDEERKSARKAQSGGAVWRPLRPSRRRRRWRISRGMSYMRLGSLPRPTGLGESIKIRLSMGSTVDVERGISGFGG